MSHDNGMFVTPGPSQKKMRVSIEERKETQRSRSLTSTSLNRKDSEDSTLAPINARLNSFSDETSTHLLPKLSAIMGNRFKITTGPTGEKTFVYRGRQSFRPLFDNVLSLVNGEMVPVKTIRYIGNIGSGKSHNLAALTYYLRELKAAEGQEFHCDVIYISSCRLFFTYNAVKTIKMAICETFPNEEEAINVCKNWDDLVAYIGAKPKWSILFIYDDWSYVLSKNLADILHSERGEYAQTMLIDLSFSQYRIEAISEGCESLTTDSKAPEDTNFLSLFGGLTQKEWTAWKSNSGSVFAGISDKDDAMVVDFTGLVPLNLRTLEELEEGDLYDRVDEFYFTEVGRLIKSNLQKGHFEFIGHVEGGIYLHQVVNALSEVKSPLLDHRFYDHRYFYFDYASKVLRPVSGFVRRIMRDMLDEKVTVKFREQINLGWVSSAFRYGNRSVQGFAFEEYCLLQILRYPSQYLNGIPEGTPCKLVRFEGEFPESWELNDDGLTLFWPKKFNLAYVDAIARYVCPAASFQTELKKSQHSGTEVTQSIEPQRKNIINIIGVQVTIQEPKDNQNSLQFFTNCATTSSKYSNFVKFVTSEELEQAVAVTKQLAWVIPSKRTTSTTSPGEECPPSSDCTQFVRKVRLG